ncbi:MAG: site-2 protease family protein, partial [Lachnospiraceae bacterium]|nr:site-2 protease family protein [Lachnospiraceae bacterium]
MIRTIILFLIIFGIVVISHEFGHFIIARKNGIRVLEFSVGMGPTLFSYTKNGIKYSLKLLPIGGACMFDGEDGITASDEAEEPGGLFRRSAVEPRETQREEAFDPAIV